MSEDEPIEVTIEKSGNNEDEVWTMSEGHHSPTNNPSSQAAAADRSSLQSIELGAGKEEEVSSSVKYPKFTRLNLTAIPVRQVTKRWDHSSEDDDAEANLDGGDTTDDLRKDLPDTPKTCWCVSVSVILTVFFYLVLLGTVPALLVVLGRYLDWYKKENCTTNATSTNNNDNGVIVDEITGEICM